jgi:Ala-tRNA(Pro) deacylase
MTTLQRTLDLLALSDIPYVHTRHANAYRAMEVAAAEHLPARRLAKTVVVRGPGGYFLVVLPADYRLVIEELADALQFKHLRLATEEEIRQRFPDSEVGAIPPLGSIFGLTVYMDESLAAEEHIFFSAGTHRDAIHMMVTDFIRLVEPHIIACAAPDPAFTPVDVRMGG